jgi:hypothetical protein
MNIRRAAEDPLPDQENLPVFIQIAGKPLYPDIFMLRYCFVS